MSDVNTLSGLIDRAILWTPVLLLLVLAALLVFARKTKVRRDRRVPEAGGVAHSAEDDGTILNAQNTLTTPASLEGSLPEVRDTLMGASTSHPEPDTDAVAKQTLAKLERQIEEAETAGDDRALPALYLDLGRARLAVAREKDALSALRSAAGLAALHKQPQVHAHARLELAEAAILAGDPTSACEHWQMARMAFLEAGARSDGDSIDKRMRQNGCPTDWVLTDF